METLEHNAAEFGIPIYSLGSEHQGIVHVIGPELGVTQPGMTIVCGDSHTATHGAFGALAFGIGTSEVEHVLATQCLVQQKPKSMRINYVGELGYGVTAKDLILYTIGQIGVAGATGYVVEYAGPAIEQLSMEGRMTVCNMTIEGGGRAGMIAPDQTTFDYVIGRPAAPAEVPDDWRELYTRGRRALRPRDHDRLRSDQPDGHLGHEPRHGRRRRRLRAAARRRAGRACPGVHGSRGGTPIEQIKLDRVFIGSCTNSRIGDLRAAAEVVSRAQGCGQRLRDGRPRLGQGQGAG